MAARDLQHAKEFAKKHKIHRAYGSYEELAQDPDIGGSRNVFIQIVYTLNHSQVQECLSLEAHSLSLFDYFHFM